MACEGFEAHFAHSFYETVGASAAPLSEAGIRLMTPLLREVLASGVERERLFQTLVLQQKGVSQVVLNKLTLGRQIVPLEAAKVVLSGAYLTLRVGGVLTARDRLAIRGSVAMIEYWEGPSDALSRLWSDMSSWIQGVGPRTAGASVPGDDPVASDLPEAHSGFKAHFTSPIYDDVEDEFAPFGSDEGFDLVHMWDRRRDLLCKNPSISTVLEAPGGSFHVDSGDVDEATQVVAAAFTVLRLTGSLSSQDCAPGLGALAVLTEFYGPAAPLVTMRRDLESWCNGAPSLRCAHEFGEGAGLS